MPPIQPKVLTTHPSRAPQPSSGCIALFGLPFVAMGLFLQAVAWRWIELPRQEVVEHRTILALFGGVLMIAGLLLVFQTIAGKRREAWRRRRLTNDPARPWLADYPWVPEGDTYRVGTQTLQLLAGLLFLTAFLSPFNYLFFPFPAVLIFDVLLALGWAWFVYNVIQGGKYGDSRLRYASFPFYLGSQAVVFFEGIDRLKGLRELKATLRCVEESMVAGRRGKGGSVNSQSVCTSVFEEERVLRPNEIPFGEGGRARFLSFMRREEAWTALRFEFPLPEEDRYETHLAGPPVRYWELEVRAETPGVDFTATFLLPVYRRRLDPKANDFEG